MNCDPRNLVARALSAPPICKRYTSGIRRIPSLPASSATRACSSGICSGPRRTPLPRRCAMNTRCEKKRKRPIKTAYMIPIIDIAIRTHSPIAASTTNTSRGRSEGQRFTGTGGGLGEIPVSMLITSPTAPRPATTRLLVAHHHRVRTDQVLDDGVSKPDFLHPTHAIGARIVETGRCFDKHVETHEQAERVTALFVVDDRLIDDQHAAFRKRVVG